MFSLLFLFFIHSAEAAPLYNCDTISPVGNELVFLMIPGEDGKAVTIQKYITSETSGLLLLNGFTITKITQKDSQLQFSSRSRYSTREKALLTIDQKTGKGTWVEKRRKDTVTYQLSCEKR